VRLSDARPGRRLILRERLMIRMNGQESKRNHRPCGKRLPLLPLLPPPPRFATAFVSVAVADAKRV